MTRQQELVSQITSVIAEWQNDTDPMGAAIDVLEALGYTAGVIFSQAPDAGSQQAGRQHFMEAIQEGLECHMRRQTMH